MGLRQSLKGEQQIAPATGDVAAAQVIGRGHLDEDGLVAQSGEVDLFECAAYGGGNQALLDCESLTAAVAGDARQRAAACKRSR